MPLSDLRHVLSRLDAESVELSSVFRILPDHVSPRPSSPRADVDFVVAIRVRKCALVPVVIVHSVLEAGSLLSRLVGRFCFRAPRHIRDPSDPQLPSMASEFVERLSGLCQDVLILDGHLGS